MKLAVKGLAGKIRLTSEMSEEDLMNEVRSVFSIPMGNDAQFPFKFLQSTGGGAKSLNLPALSSSFHWTASQVVGLSRSCVYVLAEKELMDLQQEVSMVTKRYWCLSFKILFLFVCRKKLRSSVIAAVRMKSHQNGVTLILQTTHFLNRTNKAPISPLPHFSV